MSQLNPRPARSAALQALLDEAEAELARTEPSRPASRIPTQTHRTVGGASSRPSATPAATAGPAIGAQRQSPDLAQPDGPASAQVWETTAPRRAARVTRTVLGSPSDAGGGRRGRAARSRRVTGPSRGRRRHGRPLRKITRARTHRMVAGYGLLRLSRSGRGRSVQVRRLIRAATAPTGITPTAWSTAPAPTPTPAPPVPSPAAARVESPAIAESRASFAPRSPAEVAASYFASTPLTPDEVSARNRGAKRSEHQRRRALVVAMAAVAAVVGAVFLLTWQLGRDRTPQPPASPASVTTPAGSAAAPAVPVTSSAGTTASPGRPVATAPVAVARATTKPAPTSTGAPAVLPIPSGPTSVRPGDSHQGTVIAGSTRLTGWVLVPSSP